MDVFCLAARPSGAGDAADAMVNGDDEKQAEDSKKLDTIMITGKADNCEAAKKALLVCS